MKGCTTTGVILCGLLFYCRMTFDSFRVFIHTDSAAHSILFIREGGSDGPDKWRGQTTLLVYLEQEGYQTNRIAVEKNGEIIPKSCYKETLLHSGDVLEIVSFVGGG